MGPRSFNRGNRPSRRCRRTAREGFNGAAVFQPRKLFILLSRFPHHQGFNGATASLPWKWQSNRVPGNRRLHASMGPQSFNRGNGMGARACSSDRTRFNGAAAFQPRK